MLQDNKYNIFSAEIDSNNILIFLKNIFKYNISHPCLHVIQLFLPNPIFIGFFDNYPIFIKYYVAMLTAFMWLRIQ